MFVVLALSIQHGYVKTKGINLIVSGLNNPSKKNGGSGIYLHNGKIAQAYISGTRGSKLIIQDVPKVPTATPVDTCKVNFLFYLHQTYFYILICSLTVKNQDTVRHYQNCQKYIHQILVLLLRAEKIWLIIPLSR